jgi:F0F1-type ATP synthase membrane subunit b/b'
MSLLDLIEQLEEEVDQSQKALFSSMHKIDPDRILEIIDEMRDEIPKEVQQSRQLLSDKQRILDDAQVQADHILSHARMRAEQLCEQDQIVVAAKERAGELMSSAQQTAKEMRASAKAYVEDLMHDIEGYLNEYLQVVRKNLSTMEEKRPMEKP